MTASSRLPIDVESLLRLRGIESERLEIKTAWNRGPTADQVVRTVCAFANDFREKNGGYVVLGVEERDGVPVLPPKGLERETIVRIQKEVRAQCERLEPKHQPIQSVETLADRLVLVLWVPASDDRPHTAPSSRQGERRYYIRLGAETVEARGALLTELLERAGRRPFDDRPAHGFSVDDLRATLVREHLKEVGSGLLDEPDDLEVYRGLRLTERVNGHEVPRNVALLFFSDDPERAFPGARIEAVVFGEEGDALEEHTFRGPLPHQVRECVRFLEGRTAQHVRKVEGKIESETWSSYPLAAIEEAIANAAHHRSYDQNPEPTKVYLHADRLEITSYPGPVRGLEPLDFAEGATLPSVAARNRRIGELLKDLALAEIRGTGIRKIQRAMARNGSPAPTFGFDEGRTYFTVNLPIHPRATPVAPLAPSTPEADGLVLITLGATSIRPGVEASLPSLGLAGASFLVDHVVEGYLEEEPERLTATARSLRAALLEPIEDPRVGRLHLFYRGPVSMAPLAGAILEGSGKPVVVYHHHGGRYRPAYVMNRRFLKAAD